MVSFHYLNSIAFRLRYCVLSFPFKNVRTFGVAMVKVLVNTVGHSDTSQLPVLSRLSGCSGLSYQTGLGTPRVHVVLPSRSQ